jgi:hypothetical protein
MFCVNVVGLKIFCMNKKNCSQNNTDLYDLINHFCQEFRSLQKNEVKSAELTVGNGWIKQKIVWFEQKNENKEQYKEVRRFSIRNMSVQYNFSIPQNLTKPNNSNKIILEKWGVIVAIIFGIVALIGVAITAIVYWQQICDFFKN